MHNINKRVLPIYLFLILYILLNMTIFRVNSSGITSVLIIPLFWILLLVYTLIFAKVEQTRSKGRIEKTQLIIIYLIVYYMFYFALGLFFGYNRSPYSHDLFSIIKNFYYFLPAIVIGEYIRYTLAQYTKKKIWILAILVILFSLIELNYNGLFSIKNGAELFKYTCSMVLPVLFKNILLVYVAKSTGYKASLIYCLTFEIAQLLLPIFPDLNWFYTGILGVVFPISLLIQINYVDIHSDKELTRKAVRKNSPVKVIPVFIVIVLLVCFVSGLFKFVPIAIVSNSMVPRFARGDAVVIEKLSDEEKEERLDKGDIIQFYKDGKTVVHRIHKVTQDKVGGKVFVTKGDNNPTPDSGVVKMSDIQGVVKFKMPLIGYPSVWLSEFVK